MRERVRERGASKKKRAGRFGMKCPGPRKLSPGERGGEGGREIVKCVRVKFQP